jgi:hypothetical protein
MLPPTELRLEPFQERLLEQIQLARLQGRHRNLLVAGKWHARIQSTTPLAVVVPLPQKGTTQTGAVPVRVTCQ